MMESFTDATAATCRTNNGLADLVTKLKDCTSNAELQRNTSLVSALHLGDEIGDIRATIQDSMHMGDVMFGTAGHEQITREVKHRNDELNLKKATLLKEIEKKYQIIQTSNRDFSDHLDSAPISRVLSVEDYTVFVFLLAYVFMVLIAIYTYTITSANPLQGFGKAFLAAIIGTIVGGMVFYSVV